MLEGGLVEQTPRILFPRLPRWGGDCNGAAKRGPVARRVHDASVAERSENVPSWNDDIVTGGIDFGVQMGLDGHVSTMVSAVADPQTCKTEGCQTVMRTSKQEITRTHITNQRAYRRQRTWAKGHAKWIRQQIAQMQHQINVANINNSARLLVRNLLAQIAME